MTKKLRQEMEEREAAFLAPAACLSINTRGRSRPEEECPIRMAFQRDRDRIIHCKSFRRLKHKTQVFLAPTGDHYRTRLTHVLEVSQIARTIAVSLRLNGHLTEAIALGHDLGHTPFGHAGEAVLRELHPGGFSHYEQSLRVVELLEQKGAGLNLTHEVKDGIARHSKGKQDILPKDTSQLPSTLEGRVVRIADIIAYINHDLDDALRAGILTRDQFPREIMQRIGLTHSERINTMVTDVIVTSIANEGGEKLSMTDEMRDIITELRTFLFEKVYETSRVHNDFLKAMKVVTELYGYFMENDLGWEPVITYDTDVPRHRKVCDFIAGMTDRFALDLYTELFLPKPWAVY